MVYAERYKEIMDEVRKGVENLWNTQGAPISGDLWEEDAKLEEIKNNIEEAQNMLREVSRIAFERVMNK